MRSHMNELLQKQNSYLVVLTETKRQQIKDLAAYLAYNPQEYRGCYWTALSIIEETWLG